LDTIYLFATLISLATGSLHGLLGTEPEAQAEKGLRANL
jgi:hypothetical protein